MRRGRAIVAAALALAAVPAAAFRRTEAVDANNAPVAGRCLWWAGKQVSYTVNASAANTAGCTDAAGQLQQIQQSVAAWGAATPAGASSPCTDFRFAFGGTSQGTSVGFARGVANENLIVFRHLRCQEVAPAGDACRAAPGDCAEKYNCWEHGTETIALTTTSFDANTGEIVDADMELFDGDYSRRASGYWFTCLEATSPPCSGSPTPACVSMDLGSTITHESGHMLGLAHNCTSAIGCSAPEATMFPSASVGEITKRVLKADDVEGVCTIYPVGQPPAPGGGLGESGAACKALPAPEPSKSSGCSTAGGGTAGLLLALAGLARVRLRGALGRLRLRRR